ncbi:hypothetical protein Holit_03350 [Hollandina sp. SP2]
MVGQPEVKARGGIPAGVEFPYQGADLSRQGRIRFQEGFYPLNAGTGIEHVPAVYVVQQRIYRPKGIPNFFQHGDKPGAAFFLSLGAYPGIFAGAFGKPRFISQQFPYLFLNPGPVTRKVIRCLEPLIGAVQDFRRINIIVKVKYPLYFRRSGFPGKFVVMTFNTLGQHFEGIDERDSGAVGIQ